MSRVQQLGSAICAVTCLLGGLMSKPASAVLYDTFEILSLAGTRMVLVPEGH